MLTEALFDGSGNFVGSRCIMQTGLTAANAILTDHNGTVCIRYTLTAGQLAWLQHQMQAGTLSSLPLSNGFTHDATTGLVTAGSPTGLSSM